MPAERERLKMLLNFFKTYLGDAPLAPSASAEDSVSSDRSEEKKVRRVGKVSIKLAQDVDYAFLESLAKQTEGFSGRQLSKASLFLSTNFLPDGRPAPSAETRRLQRPRRRANPCLSECV